MSVTLELAPSESLVYLYSALLSESFADDRDGYPDYEGKARYLSIDVPTDKFSWITCYLMLYSQMPGKYRGHAYLPGWPARPVAVD